MPRFQTLSTALPASTSCVVSANHTVPAYSSSQVVRKLKINSGVKLTVSANAVVRIQ